MKNKKTLMFFSSMLILIFHFWINIFERDTIYFEIETFIRQICFIGVDIFFFLSAFSISKQEIKDYPKFIYNRFKKVYLLYLIFSIIGFIYFKWDLKYFIETIIGIRLILDGGGSFLWFVPAIMLIYILLPLYNKIEVNNRILTPLITIILWLIFTVIISLFTAYKEIFILTNRIPIILIGANFAKYNIFEKLNKKQQLISTSILITIGIFILYRFLNYNISFINDAFYLFAIPFTLGLIFLINLISPNKIINKLGSITLEIYGIQMIFGYKITSVIFETINKPFLTNILTIISIIIFAYVFNKIIKFLFYKKAMNYEK